MKRTILSLASLALLIAAAACGASSSPTGPDGARFDGVIGSGTVTGGGGEASADTTGRGGGTIGSGT